MTRSFSGIRTLLALACFGCASVAGAATWVDKYGRTLTLQAPGLAEASLATGTRTPAELAASFKALCLDVGLDRVAAGKAAEAAGFRYVSASMPFKEPVDIGSWVAPDAELSVARDMFFAKEPQCNLVAMPASADGAAAIAGLTSLIGTPVNAAKAQKKDGTPDNRWSPEWVVPGASPGNERRVFFHQLAPGRVQFAAIERKGASK